MTPSYVVKTYYTDSECGKGAFYQSIEDFGGACFLGLSNDDNPTSVQSFVANNTALNTDDVASAPFIIVTRTYTSSENCSGNSTETTKPLQTGVCLASSDFAGASYIAEIETTATSTPSISVSGAVVIEATYSSQADCGNLAAATQINAYAADACIPSGAGHSAVFLNPLRPLRIGYLTPNCTGPGSIYDFGEALCAFDPSAASSKAAVFEITFSESPSAAESRETKPGYLSTTFFNNRTGRAYQQQFIKFDSDLCSLVYLLASDDVVAGAVDPVMSRRTYVGRVLPGSTSNLDYYYSDVYYASLSCTGPVNVSSVLVQPGLFDADKTQVSYIFPSSPVPPAFSFTGFVTSRWAQTSSCADASKIDSSYVQAVNMCFPQSYPGIASAVIINDSDQGKFFYYESGDCTGPPMKRVLGVFACQQTAGRNSISQAFTSPPSDDLLRTLYFLDVSWLLRVVVAALGSVCGLAMLALLLDLNKWSDFNSIVFALALLQICVDASFMADENRNTPQPEYFIVDAADKGSVHRFYLVYTTRYFFTIATSYTSNVLTLMVVYVVSFRKSLSLRKSRLAFVALCCAIFAISFLPTSIFVLHEYDVFDNRGTKLFAENNTSKGSTRVYNHAVNAVRYVVLASIAVNTLGLLYICLKTATRGSKDRSLRVTAEISKRLSIYPLVQVVTLAPAMWYDLQYFSSGSASDDDSYYQTKQYAAAWVLQSALTPSGGIWFFLLLLHFSPEVRARLYMRYCRLVGREHDGLGRGPASSALRVQHYIHCQSAKAKATATATATATGGSSESGSSAEAGERRVSSVRDEIPVSEQGEHEEGDSAGAGQSAQSGAEGAEGQAHKHKQKQDSVTLLPPPTLADFDEDELAAIVDGLHEKASNEGAMAGEEEARRGQGQGQAEIESRGRGQGQGQGQPLRTGQGQGGLTSRLSLGWSWRAAAGSGGTAMEQGAAGAAGASGGARGGDRGDSPPRRPGSVSEHPDSFKFDHSFFNPSGLVSLDLLMVENPLATAGSAGSGGKLGRLNVISGGVRVAESV